MNSPPDPGSPISTDTESPPPEEISPPPSSQTPFQNLASHISQTFAGSGAKRRLPGGSSYGASSSNRDPKSRRRGDLQMTSTRTGAGGSIWEGSKEKQREERDLVDHGVVEFLRKEIGDPFQDTVVLKYA
ncbi:hypothetical protein LshimejAT787_0201360 [Lyophyllum shimeji]|uniref:Uncharacterized protein n=1 Tax=Lyophyllum shimeji TaxID=47721 RepID=A0A9P3UKP6_LYOSH|nr:hypothetical protein LshimejAT787_0201360 [Lyophyllum shimeji]